jgi:hypothetical protein
MGIRVYLTYFTILTILLTLILSYFQFNESLSGYSLLSWISLILFSLFSLIFYFGGKKTIKSEDIHLFSKFFLAATVIKMLTSLTVVLLYFFIVKPLDKLFIIPFFLVYLFFTIFEVYFMSKIGSRK